MKHTFTLFVFAMLTNVCFATVQQTWVYDHVYNSGEIFYYDVDADGDDDFSISRNSNNYHFYVTTLKSTSYFSADASNKPKAYSQGAGMGTYHWQTGNGMLVENSGSGGYFEGVTKYLMVKFDNTNGQTFYGWFYIMGETGHVEIMNYAYQDVAGQTITAGVMTTGIENVSATVSFVKNISAGSIAFENCNQFDAAKIYDVTGRTVAEVNQPADNQLYSLEQRSGILVVSYFRKGSLLGTTKHVVMR